METGTKGKVKGGVGEKGFGRLAKENLKEMGYGTRRMQNQGASVQLERSR